MTQPRIVLTLAGEAVITVPYHHELIEALKDAVPSYARSWDRAAKAWTIRRPYIERAAELVAWVYPDVVIEEEKESTQRTTSTRTSRPAGEPYTVLHLLPSAPPELVESAYKTLARLYHPDLGGSTETMQELNTAVEEIRRQIA